ncbi:alpha-amylase family glycosyl hydrolase [Orenia marismortui]|uniref:Alpha-amylase n=1 Tax=Orenia marismortui TaxID=46469 RepID=A0A4R8GVN0_9FIRM|nr:alpha-amylase family glycosyl hydrolase [Orenia marismortui]TDX49063.1 glycosidase [Orenia marismortui]
MKKKILLFLLIATIFLLTACNDQLTEGKLSIKVKNQFDESVEQAKVSLDGLNAKQSNAEGVITFNITKPDYELKISKVGYDTLTKKIVLREKESTLVLELKKKDTAVIVDEKEYIDIDDKTVKFLFKTNPYNKVSFYLGEDSNNLTVKEQNIDYDNEGLEISNLKAGKTYYYKIEAKNNEDSTSTEVITFKKLGNTNNWEAPDWPRKAVFYEIFVRSFYDGNNDGVGDFVGLKEKIPYLKDLGVDALWLMPINSSPSYHSYDVVDYYDTNEDYGTIEEFQEFLRAAHENGIKVIMDLVINHTGDKHPWFKAASKEEENKYTDYYVWRDQFDDIYEKGPWGQMVWHKVSTPEYYYGTFWSGMPDLNLRNHKVREEMKKIAKFWLDPNQDGDFSDGVDGFRLDAALHIDEDGDVTHNWWQEFNSAVKKVNPEAFLVGENWTETDKMAQFFEDLDASFNFSLADQIIRMVNGEPRDILGDIEYIHNRYSRYSKDFIDATFLRNHDQNRVAHDLVENKEKMKLASSLLLTLPGTPFLYYGEELGQMGAKPDDNIREPFDWYADAAGEGMTIMAKSNFYNKMKYTEANDGISLEEQKGVEGSVFEHYKEMIKIRKENPIFSTGNYEKIDTPARTYSYRVSGTDQEYNLYVIHNLSSDKKIISVSSDVIELINDSKYKASDSIELKAYGTLILKVKDNNLVIN